jgi:ABC-2 type transport system permease protein
VSVDTAEPGQLLGRPIRGPSALGGSVARFAYLTRTLAVTDFKLKFFGSALGYLWQLMRPLMLFGVLYVVFTQVVRLGNDVAFYPAVLLTGIVLYTFFAEATGGAVTCVLDRENLVRKIQFPRLVVPLAVILTAYFNLGLNLVAVLVFIVASGVDARLTWLELPLLVLILGVLCTGVAMLLSALYVRFRDVKPIWDVLLQVAFYSSPVLYAIENVPSEKLQHALMLNPLAAIIQQARHAVIDPGAPSAAAAAGGWEVLLIPAALVVGLFALGFWVFNHEAPRIAEEL